MEALIQRHFGIIDARLAKQRYMLGDAYTIVDMVVWGWARLILTVLGETAWAKFPDLKRLVEEISARPAAQRAVALRDKHKFAGIQKAVATAAAWACGDEERVRSCDDWRGMLREEFLTEISARQAACFLMSDSAGMPRPSCSRQIILSVSGRLRLSTSCTRFRLPMKGIRSRG